MSTKNSKTPGEEKPPVKVMRKKYTIRGDLHDKLKFVAAASNVKLMDSMDRIADREIRSWESDHKVKIDSLARGRLARHTLSNAKHRTVRDTNSIDLDRVPLPRWWCRLAYRWAMMRIANLLTMYCQTRCPTSPTQLTKLANGSTAVSVLPGMVSRMTRMLEALLFGWSRCAT